MSDKLNAIKIKYPDGTYSKQILLNVKADNVQVNSTTTLLDVLNLMDARIDQIIAPTSSTLTLDEEVRDIRVGKDATRTTTVNYPSAGTAVRTQLDEMRASLDGDISDLKSAVNEINKNIYFIYDRSLPDFTIGRYWHRERGRYYNSVNCAASVSLINDRKAVTFTNSDYQYWINGYSDRPATDTTFVREITNGKTDAGVITPLPSDIPIITLTVQRIDGATIQSTEQEAILNGFVFYNFTDKSLTKENALADAKAVGDILFKHDDTIKTRLSQSIFDPNIIKGRYIGLDDGMSHSSNDRYARTALWYGKDNRNAIILTDDTYEFNVAFYDDAGNLSTGAGYIESTDYVANKLIYIPDTAVYFGITFRTKDGSLLTDNDINAIKANLKCYSFTDTTLTQQNKAADAKAVGNELAKLKEKEPLNFVTYPGSIIYSTGEIRDYQYANHTDYIDVSEYETILYKQIQSTADSSNIGLAFYDNQYNYIPNSGVLSFLRADSYDYAPNLELCYIPNNATYVRLSTLDPDSHGDFEIYGLRKVPNPPMELHTFPQNEGAYNAIRNARKITDIKWTPSVNIPRASIMIRGYTEFGDYAYFEDVFLANQEYSGIPYSTFSNKNPGQGLFTERPIDTFLTSVIYPRSIEAMESRYSQTTGSYYGNNCTMTTSYCLNLPPVSSQNWMNIPGIRKIMDVISDGVKQDLNNIKLADILQKNGHCAIVTDIIKNDDKTIKFIEVSEQTRSGNMNKNFQGSQYGGKARRLTWTPDEFYTQFGDYSILRFDYLNQVKYVPSKYVPMVNEGKRYDFIYLPLVPYRGNFSYLLSGSVCKLLIEITNYTHLYVKKNGVFWNENGTTQPYNIAGLTSIDINCDDDEAIYTAYLAMESEGEIQTTTVECTWFVEGTAYVNTSVGASNIIFTVGIKTKNFKPWFINLTASQSITSGKNRMIFNGYEVLEGNTNYPYMYRFNAPYSGTAPTKYVIGMWSDDFGVMYIRGTF